MDTQRYTVTMKHDAGTVKITTYAESIEKAVQFVCRTENAPPRSVIAVRKS